MLIKHDFIRHSSKGTKQCHIVWQERASQLSPKAILCPF